MPAPINPVDHTDPLPDGWVWVCFQFVTRGGAVIDTKPEGWPDIEAATTRAEEFMNLPPGKNIRLITYEGDGGVVRVSELEHIAVFPLTKIEALYKEYEKEATTDE